MSNYHVKKRNTPDQPYQSFREEQNCSNYEFPGFDIKSTGDMG
jgi:hypothetical protein